MNSLQKYLKEKEEYFFPQEIELEIKQVSNNSDSILDANEFMNSNSDIQTYYAKGNGFKIDDSQDFYEVIKQVKDIIDKHLFIRNFKWKVDIKGKYADLYFTINDNFSNEEEDDFFINGMEQSIIMSIYKKFPGSFIINSQRLKDLNGKKSLKLTILKNKNNSNNNIINIKPSNNSSFYGKYSSISNM